MMPHSGQVGYPFVLNPAPRNPCSPLNQRKIKRIRIIHILRRSFNPVTTGSKQAIPHSRLLAVVVALSPSFAVVQVVIFDDQLAVEVLQKESSGAWSGGEDSQAAVSESFGEDDVFVADPPVVEALEKVNDCVER